jgi:menaquinone-dependent protoporphyrinogen oxidase
MLKILVTYASKHHSTEQIAEMIGVVLRENSLNCIIYPEVRPVETVTDLSPYEAVVLGSAIYSGHWLPAAEAFLQKHQLELAKRPLWLFSSGPVGEGDVEELIGNWTMSPNLRSLVEGIKPRDVTVFRGNLDPEELSLFEKVIVKGMAAPTGDYREWEVIRQWAHHIAQMLCTEYNTDHQTDFTVDWST